MMRGIFECEIHYESSSESDSDSYGFEFGGTMSRIWRKGLFDASH